MARSKNKHRRKAAKSAASPSASPSSPSSSPLSPSASPPSPSSSPLSPSSPSPSPTIAAAALCLLIAVAFFPATMAGFVWDDDAFTLAEPVAAWSGIAQIWFAPRALTLEGHYWPVLYSTFWLEHKLWGFNPLGFHLVNLALHSAVTVLLWRLLSRLKIPGAWFAAAIFAVHPVHAEPVVWAIGRKDVLAALFFLSAAWFYFNFADHRRRRDYTVAIALFVAGMLSKSVVVTLPAALLLWHWWRQGNITVADITRVLPFIVIGAAITVADWSYYRSIESVDFGYTLIERALIAAQALWFYAGKLIWPTELMVIYPRWEVGVGDPLAWMALVAALALPCTLWFARRRVGRGALAAVAFFALALSPVLGIVDYGFMQFAFVADRYQYLAAAGVIVIVTAAAAQLIRRVPPPARKVTVTAVALAVLLPLSALSWQQANIYRDAGTFLQHIFAHNPDARGMAFTYAVWLRDEGRYEDALAAYRIAEKQTPDKLSIANDMGVIFERLGRAGDAEQKYRRALQLDPRATNTMHNLAMLLMRQRRYDEALQSFDRALELEPSLANVRANREALLRLMANDGEDN